MGRIAPEQMLAEPAAPKGVSLPPMDPVQAIPSPDSGDARACAKSVAGFATPNTLRSLFELFVTAAPLAGLWTVAWLLVDRGHWAGLLLVFPAAAFLVRLFMIQHDCGHGAFFKSRALNDWVGRAIGVLTVTPYAHWRRTHAIHHATSGDLDRRGLGAIELLTIDEFAASGPVKRLRYRLYRHPAVLFGLGPTYMFLLQQRLPIGFMREGWRPWASVMGANLALALLVAAGVWAFGPASFLLVWLPTLVLAGTVGVWLFYVQHQFDRTLFARKPEWSHYEAALYGSSHYHLPAVLRWFTANIGVHHVHHLNSRIPFYRLGEALRDKPALKDIGRVTLGESFRSVRLSLWDEAQGRLVSFREAAETIAGRPGLGPVVRQ